MEITWVGYNSIRLVDGEYVSDFASARYRLLIPMRGLVEMGYHINLLRIDERLAAEKIAAHLKGEVVIFSKLIAKKDVFEKHAHLILELARLTSMNGQKVIADINDDHFSHSHFGAYFRELVNLADIVVASTTGMADVILQHTSTPVHFVGDPYEGPRGAAEFDPPRGRRTGVLGRVYGHFLGPRTGDDGPLRLLWFGHGTNLGAIVDLLPKLAPIVGRHNVELHLVTSSNADLERLCREFNDDHGPTFCLRFSLWSAQTTWRALRDCDLVVIPVRMGDSSKLVKSPNRLIEGIRAGRFVVANPIPSYEEFSDFAWLGDNVVHGIKWALEHPHAVRRRIAAGQNYIVKSYSPEAIARQWDAAIMSAMNLEAAAPVV